MTKRPIVDRAEVGIDFPDKSYLGSFTRHSAFEAAADHEGVTIRLIRPGTESRQADIHLHYHLFADVLDELAGAIAAGHPVDEAHRGPLLAAARHLAA
ncbi:MAG TPA: hypothetical protein P5558_04210, partial [Geminicoccaceae bacterium]|nr:hypothetical protein [Geminicoccaceae bacterium]